MNRTIYVDVDGTICTSRSLKKINLEEFKDIQSDYENAKPHRERIDQINSLYEKGHNIIYWTARGSVSGIDLKEFTKNQFCITSFGYPIFLITCDHSVNSKIQLVAPPSIFTNSFSASVDA